MEIKNKLLSKIQNDEAKIGIIGLGYVGLPLLLRFSEVGFKVLGFDINEKVANSINEGLSFIEHISSERIKAALDKGAIEATISMERVDECDAIIICVPTPLNKNDEPDLSYIISTIESIKDYLKEGQIISLESTTYPGTTEEEIVSRVQERKLEVGKNFFVVYSPEREDPGNQSYDTSTIPKICGGHTLDCADIGVSLYKKAANEVIKVSSTKVAEMTKLLENIHRAVNIGLVNEMKIISNKMGIDIYEVIDAASTKPFGFTPYYPGPGLGGHCIPIDPFYLTWRAKQYGIDTKFIELSGKINKSMPNYVIENLKKSLLVQNKKIDNSNILILGIAYKKNVDDVRESPSVKIMEMLKDKGASIAYSDPHVAEFPKMRDYYFDLKSIDITKENLSQFDAVILATDHDKFDYNLIKKYANLIIDCRGKYRENFLRLVKS